MKNISILIILLMVTVSCQKEPEEVISKTYSLSGYAQKGPFLLGSEVTIIELNNNLSPTGKVFFSTIENDLGYFSFPDIEFESNYVQLKVDGGYYNEVSGGVNYLSELRLKSIVDISNNSTINVNLITHLVQARTFELVKNGEEYSTACDMAYNELLSLFFIENNISTKPENLNLIASDPSGGILLLVSAIIQSNIGSGLIFSEFLATLENDFKDNGKIDNNLIQKTLGTSGLVLIIEEIRNNLTSRYSELGQTIEPYVDKQFLYNFNNLISYPTIFDDIFPSALEEYTNLINKGDSISIDKNKSYAIAIKGENDPDFSSIQIRITSTSNNYTAKSINWFIEGDQKIYLKEYDGTDLIIPIEFVDSGKLELELFIVTRSSSMVKYPKIIVSWS